jgi:hypothetical protein
MEMALAELSIEDMNDEADDKDFIVVIGMYFIVILLPHKHPCRRGGHIRIGL